MFLEKRIVIFFETNLGFLIFLDFCGINSSAFQGLSARKADKIPAFFIKFRLFDIIF